MPPPLPEESARWGQGVKETARYRHKLAQHLPMEEGQGSNLLNKLVSRLGLEPRALALKGRCSTD